MLTEEGVKLAQVLLAPTRNGDLLPRWDGERRELRLGDQLVKRFRQPAGNQEKILAAFEEEHWPAHIDNHLSGDSEKHATDRLHDAVKRLNKQACKLIRFRCDGHGEGVCWEPIS